MCLLKGEHQSLFTVYTLSAAACMEKKNMYQSTFEKTRGKCGDVELEINEHTSPLLPAHHLCLRLHVLLLA